MRAKTTLSFRTAFQVIRRSTAVRAGVITLALGLLSAGSAEAASLQPVSNWGASGVPSYISMFIYVPDKAAANPPILVVSHYCSGSANGVFGQARTAGIVAAADQYGFIMIVPQTTNPATSANCWDVGSKQSLTHDGGGDTQAIAQMVTYTVATYGANADRVYATGDSSGAMMTQALLAVYPEVFKAGASFAGVPAGCWSAGWSAASNWGGTCAGGRDVMSASAWGDLARGMDPGYTGHRPRVMLVQGDADPTINYANFGEGIKEWTNVLGLDAPPTSTASGRALGSHQATRQQWKNDCGYVVLDALTSIGGDHGPSDALFSAGYTIPFLGLDTVGPVDPEVAACSGGGTNTGDAGGASEDGGSATGTEGGGAATPVAVGTTGMTVGAATPSGVDATGTNGGSVNAPGEGTHSRATSASANSNSAVVPSSLNASSGCALSGTPGTSHEYWANLALLGFALLGVAAWRRSSLCSSTVLIDANRKNDTLNS